MTKSSTASFIAYALRPAKQAERRLLLDFLKCANEAGHGVSDCRYVGMGGTMFYDFHLMHRFLGISRMVSLERDPEMYPRCDFNRPFDFIRALNMTTADFLVSDQDETKTIYWFDYDDGINPDMTADIISLGTRVKLGGFAFVTVSASPPGALSKKSNEHRLEYFQHEMGAFSIGLVEDDMQNMNFPSTICRILVAAFTNAFAARTDGRFRPLFKVQYKDSVQMVSVGGFFCRDAEVAPIVNRVGLDLPFLLTNSPYKIKNLNLTERERALFDLAVTKSRTNSKQANSLRSLGFGDSDLEAYRDLIRFLPRYHEAII